MEDDDYLLGCAIMGLDTIPQAGLVYNDRATVTAVQQALEAKGFHLKKGVDGAYGPDTAQAIRAMQSASGVPQTGVIDYGVLSALGIDAPAPSGPVAPPLSGGYASIFRPASATPATPGVAVTWLQREAFGGIKVWQAGVGAIGLIALTGGLVALARK